MARSRRKSRSRHASGHNPTGSAHAETKALPPNTIRWSADKRPVVRAVVIFAVVMGGYYALDFTPFFGSQIRQWYLEQIASTTAGILNLLGHDATTYGTSIRSSQFSVKIVRGCDALEPVAAFVAAVFASPVAFRLMVPGVLVGVVSLLTINLLRIVSLYFIGIHFRAAFDMMHYEFWQAVFIVLAIAAWAIWVQWATRAGKSQSHVAD